jgi:SAM-dependent methyltransferase
MPEQVGGDIVESPSFRSVKRLILRLEFGYLRRVGPLRLLEIGSGSGELARFLQSMGHEVVCSDVAEESLANIAREYGLATICGPVQDADLGQVPFDGVVMRHVFEHFEDPDGIIHKLREHLAPQGRLLLTQPNLDSWCRRVAGSNWNWTVPYHRFFWSEATLGAFLRARGFRIVKSRSVFSHLGLPRGLCVAVGQPLLRKLLTPALMPVGVALEFLAGCFHRGQNLFIEAEVAPTNVPPMSLPT